MIPLQRYSLSIKDFFINVTKSVGTADLVTFTEETLNGKLHFFLCSENGMKIKLSIVTKQHKTLEISRERIKIIKKLQLSRVFVVSRISAHS